MQSNFVLWNVNEEEDTQVKNIISCLTNTIPLLWKKLVECIQLNLHTKSLT